MLFADERIYYASEYVEKEIEKAKEENESADKHLALSTLRDLTERNKPEPVRVVADCFSWKRYFCKNCGKEQPRKIETTSMYCDKCGQLLYVEKEGKV